MHKFLTPLFFLGLSLNIALIRAQDQSDQIYKTEDGFVKFVSDAPLEYITAQSHQLKGVIDITKRTFAFRLDVNSLKGFNSPLQQEHFYENYMETEQFPTASFAGKIIENIDPAAGSEHIVRAKGLLNIHGVKQERIIKCTLQMNTEGMQVTSDFIVPLADHNISIPQLVYQKIAEEIKVYINAELTRLEN